MACTNALSVFSCDMPFLPGLVHSRVTDRIFGGDISDCSCATATTLPANNNVPNISPIIRFIGNLLCGLKSRRHSTRNLFFSNVSVSFGVSPPSNRSGVIPKHAHFSRVRDLAWNADAVLRISRKRGRVDLHHQNVRVITPHRTKPSFST